MSRNNNSKLPYLMMFNRLGRGEVKILQLLYAPNSMRTHLWSALKNQGASLKSLQSLRRKNIIFEMDNNPANRYGLTGLGRSLVVYSFNEPELYEPIVNNNFMEDLYSLKLWELSPQGKLKSPSGAIVDNLSLYDYEQKTDSFYLDLNDYQQSLILNALTDAHMFSRYHDPILNTRLSQLIHHIRNLLREAC